MSPLLKLRPFESPFTKKAKPVAPSLNYSPASGMGGMSPAPAPNMSVAPKPTVPSILSTNRSANPLSNPVNMAGPRIGSTLPPAPVNKPVAPVLPPSNAPVAPAIAPKSPLAEPNAQIGGLSPAAVPTTPKPPELPATTPTPPPTTPNVPAPAPAPSFTSPEYEAASKAYESSLEMTPEEIAIQEELNRLGQSTREGVFEAGQRAIPMGIITGQKKALEERGLNLQAPLSQRAALLQAKRLAALDAGKFKVEQEGKKLTAQQTAEQKAAESAESARRFGIEQEGATATRTLAEKKLAEDTRQADLDYKLSKEKSDEDTRRFGLEYALNQRETALKESESATKLAEKAATTKVGSTESLANYQMMNELLASPVLSKISGVPGVTAFLPGTKAQLAKNQYEQVKNILSLENRQKMKGSGTISDFEAKILAKASTSIGRNLSDADFQKELKKIRGVFATAAGMQSPVKVIDPKTKKVDLGNLGREEIDSAISQGFQVEYQ